MKISDDAGIIRIKISGSHVDFNFFNEVNNVLNNLIYKHAINVLKHRMSDLDELFVVRDPSAKHRRRNHDFNISRDIESDHIIRYILKPVIINLINGSTVIDIGFALSPLISNGFAMGFASSMTASFVYALLVSFYNNKIQFYYNEIELSEAEKSCLQNNEGQFDVGDGLVRVVESLGKRGDLNITIRTETDSGSGYITINSRGVHDYSSHPGNFVPEIDRDNA
jgi:hypothetical protein